MGRLEVYETELKDHRVCVAELDVEFYGNNFDYKKTFRGSAIRNLEDKENPDVAELLSYGRALEAAGKRFQRVAWGLVTHGDNNKAHKAKIAGKNAKESKEDRPHGVRTRTGAAG